MRRIFGRKEPDRGAGYLVVAPRLTLVAPDPTAVPQPPRIALYCCGARSGPPWCLDCPSHPANAAQEGMP